MDIIKKLLYKIAYMKNKLNVEEEHYRLVELSLENSSQPDKFTVINLNSNQTEIISLKNLNPNSYLLKKLSSSSEVFLLGYQKGMLDKIEEANAIKKLKNSKKN